MERKKVTEGGQICSIMKSRGDIVRVENKIEEMIMNIEQSSLSSVILSDANTDKVKIITEEYSKKEELIRYGLSPCNRILMYGDSGTGKTYLSGALAKELGMKLLYLNIASAVSDTRSAAKRLQDIFEYANENGNMVIFLDECDSVAWNRESLDSEGGDVRRITNTILQQIDNMSERIIVIAATNMLNKLDAAFSRRFNMKMEFRKPKIQSREEFISIAKRFEGNTDGITIDYSMDRNEFTVVRDRGFPSYYDIKEYILLEKKRAVMGNRLIEYGRILESIGKGIGIEYRI